MAGMEKQRVHMSTMQGAGYPMSGPFTANLHSNHHHPHIAPRSHSLHPSTDAQHHPKVKYRVGISILAWLQFIGGLLIMSFEAISAVLFRASANSLLHGVEYAGLYAGIFTQITGIIGLLSTRKSTGRRLQTFCFLSDILLTIFLATQTFAMSCASAAMLVLYTISWDSILNLINRVSSSAQINLFIGTSTTTIGTVSLPPVVEQELAVDFNLLIGLRSILFALYLVLFISAVLSSCLGCCNYCSCWNRPAVVESRRQSVAVLTGLGAPHFGAHEPNKVGHEVPVKPQGILTSHIVETATVEEVDEEKHGHKHGHKHHHKHKS